MNKDNKNAHTSTNEDDLIIPIYIDTNALLDIIASVEGGFSVVQKITSHTANNKSSEQSVNPSVSSEFGIPNVLNLIKVNLGGAFSWKQENGNTEEFSTERYHTYGSLFQRLRYAIKTQQIKTYQGAFKTFDGSDSDWDKIKPYTFIEVQGKFLPNPLTASLKIINGWLNIMDVFTQSGNNDTKRSKSKPQLVQPQNSLISIDPTKLEQMKQIKNILQGLFDNLEKQDIRLTLIDIPTASNHYKVVASLFTEYLRDKSLSELLYKEYKIFGKVVGKINDQDDPIDLLKGTSIEGISDKWITNMLGQFDQSSSGISLPTVKTKIEGPALEIIPVAIYV